MSAIVGTTGLLLSLCAVFGQPALYLREAQAQLHGLFASAPAEPEGDAVVTQMAQLQQQVALLRDQLAATQAATEQARLQLAATQAQQAAASRVGEAPAPDPARAPPAPDPVRAPPVALQPVPRQPQPVVSSPDRPEAPTQNPVVAERRDAPPAPLPKPRPDPARAEADNMQSVLARLRQRPNVQAQPPVDAPVAEAPAAEPANRAAPQSLQRLAMARAALMSGRVNEARRLLQEVQLQLVFRPVRPDVDDAPTAGRGASDVARALGALSGNDTLQSEHYIERALDDMAGTSTQRAENTPGLVPGGGPPGGGPLGGYAPAYPAR